jgi:glycosyltransferase involved in cell wall biosynthesis
MKKDPRIRFLHVISGSLEYGGAEIALYKLLSRLDRELFDPVVVPLRGGGAVGESLEACGVPVHSLDMQGELPTSASVWRLIRIVRQTQPDLIQGWMFHGNLAATLAGASLLRRVPIIWGMRGSLDLKAEKKLTVAVIRMGALLSAWPRRIVYVSQASVKQHEAIGYRSDRRLVIPNGFDCEAFRPDTQARASVRAELGLAEGTPLVGLVARYHPMKDHANFLAAASLLIEQGLNAHFLLIGYGADPSNKELSTRILNHRLQGRVHLLGVRHDISRLNAALDIATSSSSYGEGFPNAIGEAMACAVPCVVTDVGDSRWIVGETGRVVPPRDPVTLSAAWRDILQMGSGPRAELGERARARIVRNFSLDEVVGQYEKLYAEVIDGL